MEATLYKPQTADDREEQWPWEFVQPEESRVLEQEQEVEWVDMPHVDDLEIAAAAAEAAIAEEKRQKKVVFQRKRSLAGKPANTESSSESEASTSEEELSDEDSSMAESSEESEEELAIPNSEQEAAGTSSQQRVDHFSVQFIIDGEENVQMKLCARADEIDSEPDSEAWAVDDLREMLEHMQEDGADARAARRAAEAEILREPVMPPDVDLTDADELLPAGRVTAVLGNQVIIQAPPNGRLLEDGSILFLPDRRPLGKVEDIFGPIESPMYITLCHSSGEALKSVAPGAEICFVERLSTIILASVQAPMADAVDDDEEEEQDSLHLTDDDAEAALKRHANSQNPPSNYAGSSHPMTPGGGRAVRGRGQTGRLARASQRAVRGRNAWGRGRREDTSHHQSQQRASEPSVTFGGSPLPRGLSGREDTRGRGRHRNLQRGRGSIGQRPGFGSPIMHGLARSGGPAAGQAGWPSNPPPLRPPSGESPQGQWVWVPPEQLQPPPGQTFRGRGRGRAQQWTGLAHSPQPQQWSAASHAHLQGGQPQADCFAGFPPPNGMLGGVSPEAFPGLHRTGQNPASTFTFYPSGLP